MRLFWLVSILALLVATRSDAKPTKPPPSPTPPPAPVASFADQLDDAEAAPDLARLIDPLFDTCETSDALEHRQCEGERAFLEGQARVKTYVAVGDAAALGVSPYDATAKEVDFDIQGCLACVSPLSLSDGKGGHVQRFVTTRVPRAIKAGRAIGLDVNTLELAITKPDVDVKWKKHEKQYAPRLRTQFIFKLGDTWSSGAFSGVSFVPTAYRVFDACTGEVLITEPPLAADAKAVKVALPVQLQPGDSLHCPAGNELSPDERAERDAHANLPEFLTQSLIESALATAKDKVHKCHVELRESGTVNLRFVVEGATGKVAEVSVAPPFDQTPGGACVRAAVKAVTFSRFKGGETQEVKFPVYLR